jgi:hypothetical protein
MRNDTTTTSRFSFALTTAEGDADSQMSFAYDMQTSLAPGQEGTPYSVLGVNTEVAPGSLTICPFPALQPNTTYEWYVRVTDAAGNTVISPTGRFVTATNFAPVVANRVITVAGDQLTPMALFATDSNGDYLTLWTKSPPLHGSEGDWDAIHGTLTYERTPGYYGIDRFTYQASDGMTNSQVATVMLTVTAPSDSNTNGLPDSWEATYGISDPNADADHDGQSNLAEYFAGTNPTNAASVLKLLSIDWSPEDPFALTWSSVGGTRYRVQYSDGDANGGLPGPFTDIVRDITDEIDPSPYGTSATQSFIKPPRTPRATTGSKSCLDRRTHAHTRKALRP